jgi:hypothetical protein
MTHHIKQGTLPLCCFPLKWIGGPVFCEHPTKESAENALQKLYDEGYTNAVVVEGPCPEETPSSQSHPAT